MLRRYSSPKFLGALRSPPKPYPITGCCQESPPLPIGPPSENAQAACEPDASNAIHRNLLIICRIHILLAQEQDAVITRRTAPDKNRITSARRESRRSQIAPRGEIRRHLHLIGESRLGVPIQVHSLRRLPELLRLCPL